MSESNAGEMEATSEDKILLIVDDTPAALTIVERMVRRGIPLHLKVITRSASNTAFLDFCSDPEVGMADLVLSDVDMPPGITGPEMVRRMRLQRPDRPLPAVFMSGNADGARQTMAANGCGDDPLLLKPFGLNELIGKILEGLRKP